MDQHHSEVDNMEERELLEKLRNHLKHKDFVFNPEEKTVKGLIGAMIKRKERSGEFYCPCRMVTGDPEEDKKIICPCYYHEFEVERDGHCHCWLFVKKDHKGK